MAEPMAQDRTLSDYGVHIECSAAAGGVALVRGWKNPGVVIKSESRIVGLHYARHLDSGIVVDGFAMLSDLDETGELSVLILPSDVTTSITFENTRTETETLLADTALRSALLDAPRRQGLPPEITGRVERFFGELEAMNSAAQVHAAIDLAIQVGRKGTYFVGWCVHLGAGRASIVAISQDGSSHDLLAKAWRCPRPDLSTAFGEEYSYDIAGFHVYVPGLLLSTEQAPAVLSNESEVGRIPLPVVRVESDQIALSKLLLKFYHPHAPHAGRLMANHVGPAIETLRQPRPQAAAPKVTRYGGPPADPEISLVIPVYGRYDFVDHQMSTFCKDPFLCEKCEIIYVCDDPRIISEFADYLETMNRLHDVPVVLLDPGCNVGYAAANNLGCGAARADILLLMNSDVLPERDVWAERYVDHFRSSGCGAMGARLHYADGSIQHDGITFRRERSLGDFWLNIHPRKGLPCKSASPDPRPFRVEAATGACLMVEAATYWAVGGFDESYLIGDFEDTDLCLKIRSTGKEIMVQADVTFVHLERQSQKMSGPLDWRSKLSFYNCWLHHRKWDRLLAGPTQEVSQNA